MIQFDQVWAKLIQFNPIRSNLILFDSNLILHQQNNNPSFKWYHFYENTAIILMWFLLLLLRNLSRLWIPTRSSRSKMTWKSNLKWHLIASTLIRRITCQGAKCRICRFEKLLGAEKLLSAIHSSKNYSWDIMQRLFSGFTWFSPLWVTELWS